MTGHTAATNRDGSDYGYYSCSSRKHLKRCGNKSIGLRFIEGLVLNRLKEEFFESDHLADVISNIEIQYNSRTETKKSILKASRANLSEIDKQIGNITNAIAQGAFHKSMIDRLNELESQRETTMKSIHEIDLSLITDAPDLDSIKTQLEINALEKAESPEDLKEIIKAYVSKVIVNPDTVKIDTILTVAGGDEARHAIVTTVVPLIGYRHQQVISTTQQVSEYTMCSRI